MKLKLVSDWKRTWRYYSTWALSSVAVLPTIWLGIPEETKGLIPANWLPWIITAIAVAGLAGRLVDQGKDTDDEADDEAG